MDHDGTNNFFLIISLKIIDMRSQFHKVNVVVENSSKKEEWQQQKENYKVEFEGKSMLLLRDHIFMFEIIKLRTST